MEVLGIAPMDRNHGVMHQWTEIMVSRTNREDESGAVEGNQEIYNSEEKATRIESYQ